MMPDPTLSSLDFKSYIETQLKDKAANLASYEWEFLSSYAEQLKCLIDAEIVTAEQVVNLFVEDIKTLTKPEIVEFLLGSKQSLIPIIGKPPIKKAFLYNLNHEPIRQLIVQSKISLEQAIKLPYQERKKLIEDYQEKHAIILQQLMNSQSNVQILLDKSILSIAEYHGLDETLKLRLGDAATFKAYVWLLNQAFTMEKCFTLKKIEALIDFLKYNIDHIITLEYLSARLADGRDTNHADHTSNLEVLLSYWESLSEEEKLLFIDLITNWHEFIKDYPINREIGIGGFDEEYATDGTRTLLTSAITLCKRWQQFRRIDLFDKVIDLLSNEYTDTIKKLHTQYKKDHHQSKLLTLWWLSTISDTQLRLCAKINLQPYRAIFSAENLTKQVEGEINPYLQFLHDLLFARKAVQELFFEEVFLFAILGKDSLTNVEHSPIQSLQFIFELDDEQIIRFKNHRILILIKQNKLLAHEAAHVSDYHLAAFDSDELIKQLEEIGLTTVDIINLSENELRNVSNPVIQTFILKKFITIAEAKKVEYFQYHLLSNLPQNYTNISRIQNILNLDLARYYVNCLKKKTIPALPPAAQRLCDTGLMLVNEFLTMPISQRKAFEQPELWQFNLGFIDNIAASLFYLREYPLQEIDALTPERVRKNCVEKNSSEKEKEENSLSNWKRITLTLTLPLTSMFFGKGISLTDEQPIMLPITFNTLTSTASVIPFLSTAMLALLALYICYKLIPDSFSSTHKVGGLRL